METELLRALKTAITYLKTAYYDEQGIKDLQEVVKQAEKKSPLPLKSDTGGLSNEQKN